MSLAHNRLLLGRAGGYAFETGFTPKDLGAALVAWHQSQRGELIDPDGVAEVNDQGPAKNKLRQSTGAKKPDLVPSAQNKERGIKFDAADDELAWDFPVLSSHTGEFTFSIAIRTGSLLSNWVLIGESGAGLHRLRIKSDGAVEVRTPLGATADLTNAGIVLSATEYLLTVLRDASSDWRVVLNGSEVTKPTPFNNAEALDVDQFGLSSESAAPFGEMLFELIVATVDMQAGGELTGWESYISRRWAIP